jgi:carboxypeptidase Q
MFARKIMAPVTIVVVSIAFSLFAAQADKKNNAGNDSGKPSYELSQPDKESLDYQMYKSIREEALSHSRIMEYASALADGIGPRLTGSPNMKRANEWTRDQLAAMGCGNAHLEDWGEFGMGWQQLNTWMRMTSPDTAVFIVQAAPWSPATNGIVNAPAMWLAIQDEKDFEKYRGKVTGKIIFLGDMREVKPIDKPFFSRYDDTDLAKIEEYPLKQEDTVAALQASYERLAFREKIGQFLAAEGALAVIRQSRDSANGGGSGGIIFDDNGGSFGRLFYKADHKAPIPSAIAAIENYGRVYRLLKANVPVTIELNIETKFTGDHEHGFNTIAEITGTDPKLKDEVVMFGGHLDSWAAGTGATDNGAGTVVAMEVMRILSALHVKPRRTIRVALWTGEEVGHLGSVAYVAQHFGSVPRSTEPDQLQLPERNRQAVGPIQLKPEHEKITGYFNVDGGGGKIRGVYLQENAGVAHIFAQWMEPLKDVGVTALTLQNAGWTDHESFDAVGIPGFQFIQDPLDYDTRTHHSNMDTFERLQPGDLSQAAFVEAVFVYNAAMRDQLLPRKPFPHPEFDLKRSEPLKNVTPGAEP